jgi:hypothetical protein
MNQIIRNIHSLERTLTIGLDRYIPLNNFDLLPSSAQNSTSIPNQHPNFAVGLSEQARH